MERGGGKEHNVEVLITHKYPHCELDKKVIHFLHCFNCISTIVFRLEPILYARTHTHTHVTCKNIHACIQMYTCVRCYTFSFVTVVLAGL